MINYIKMSKKIIQTSYFFTIAMIIGLSSYAQGLPEINYRDYNFNKRVKQVATMYYSLDEGASEKVELVTRNFNTAGNLLNTENKRHLDNSWSKSTVTYRDGKPFQQIFERSNPYLDKIYSYKTDKTGKIIQHDIQFKDLERSTISYSYKDGLLYQITADVEGTKSVSTHFYSIKKELYKKTHRELGVGYSDIVTQHFYLGGKEIMSYDEPKNNFKVYTYFYGSVEMSFKLVEDSVSQEKLLKGITRFDNEAPMAKLPYGLAEYSEQTLQFYDKNKDKLIRKKILIFVKNENNDIIAEAEVDLKLKKLAGINFSKITYADGKISGGTVFNNETKAKLEATLAKLEL